MRDKLRLVVDAYCNRSCEGCCNNDHDLEALPVVDGYEGYNSVILTGGEPMLFQNTLMNICQDVRDQNSDAKIILYTAKSKRAMDLVAMLHWVDGITLTLHEPYDLQPFIELNNIIKTRQWNKSLRLNVFKPIDMTGVDTGQWDVHDEMEWIVDCPLPVGEELRRYWP